MRTHYHQFQFSIAMLTRCPQLSDLKKATTIYLLTIIQFEQGLVEMARLHSVLGRVGRGNSTGAE